jgi:hypothetical protein
VGKTAHQRPDRQHHGVGVPSRTRPHARQGQAKKEVFFFEKKNQKTFALAPL